MNLADCVDSVGVSIVLLAFLLNISINDSLLKRKHAAKQ